jgi:hypothetical protein
LSLGCHRGRLNVLGNVVRKPLRQIFSEFSGGTKPVDEGEGLYTGTGDVKYHLGTSYDRPTRGGKHIHLSLVANPSHLEAVNPIVAGKTRAKQYHSNDRDRTKNLGVLLHGDGSFSVRVWCMRPCISAPFQTTPLVGPSILWLIIRLHSLPTQCQGGLRSTAQMSQKHWMPQFSTLMVMIWKQWFMFVSSLQSGGKHFTLML